MRHTRVLRRKRARYAKSMARVLRSCAEKIRQGGNEGTFLVVPSDIVAYAIEHAVPSGFQYADHTVRNGLVGTLAE